MRRFTEWLVSRMVSQKESLRDPQVRSRLGVMEGWVSTAINLALAGIKMVLGIMLQSAGLISDAVHSLADMGSSLVVIVGFRISQKPADPEHPFGHERSEQIAGLIIAILLVIAGFEIGKGTLTSLLEQPQNGSGEELTWPIFAILFSLLLVKEALAGFSQTLGKMIQSKALEADAWHHRSDAISTGIAIIGLAGRNIGWPWLDGVAGLAVCGFIVAAGVQLAYQAISPLLGETATPEEIENIKTIGNSLAEVIDVHDVRVNRYGQFNFTTLHIGLSDRLTVHKMHEITVQVETRILRHFPGECVVHMDPIDLHHPLFNNVTEIMREAVIKHADLVDFHDLKLWSENGKSHGNVEVSVEPETKKESYPELTKYILRKMEEHHSDVSFEVFLKVDFSSRPIGT